MTDTGAALLQQDAHSEGGDRKQAAAAAEAPQWSRGRPGQEAGSSLSGHHTPRERSCLHPESNRKSLEALRLAGEITRLCLHLEKITLAAGVGNQQEMGQSGGGTCWEAWGRPGLEGQPGWGGCGGGLTWSVSRLGGGLFGWE